jgi:phytanoyl-CoA hydroxylase
MYELYKKQGYAVVRNFVEVSDLLAEMRDVFARYLPHIADVTDQVIFDLFKDDFAGFYGCANICQYLASLTSLSASTRVCRALGELGIKMPVINTRPLVSFSSRYLAKNESYWKVPAHQDWPSTQGSLNGLTCWIPLVDVPTELGPLEMIPGSHLNGAMEHKEQSGVPICGSDFSEGDFVPVPMKAGDALFFSYFTVHRSGTNTTADKIRWTIHLRYDDRSELSFIQRKYPKNRKDVRTEGLLIPGFPDVEQVRRVFA